MAASPEDPSLELPFMRAGRCILIVSPSVLGASVPPVSALSDSA
jgi:hypothetical protein